MTHGFQSLANEDSDLHWVGPAQGEQSNSIFTTEWHDDLHHRDTMEIMIHEKHMKKNI